MSVSSIDEALSSAKVAAWVRAVEVGSREEVLRLMPGWPKAASELLLREVENQALSQSSLISAPLIDLLPNILLLHLRESAYLPFGSSFNVFPVVLAYKLIGHI